jgi:small nuclear ribonucleoprotein (snRNP)-like protein
MVLPMEMLDKLINSTVSLLLKDGRTVEGKLTGYDAYMNIVVDDAQEKDGDNVKRLGKVVLRGNSITSILQA